MEIEIRPYSDEELAMWLGLAALPLAPLTWTWLSKVIDRFAGPECWTATRSEIFQRDPEYFGANDRIEAFIRERSKIDIEKLFKEATSHPEIKPICIGDPRYPFRLRHIHDAPLVLFMRGELRDTDFTNAVAIVGTRAPSPYGSSHAKQIAKGLAEQGVPIISGLAIGTDSYAHWGAVEGKGRTVAVLASGCDYCYPSSNKRLFQAILDGHGLVISEFFPGVKPDKWHFPARNRIIAGVSQSVIVIEAGEKSGALITAELAADQGRNLFALPGRVDVPTSKGTNALLALHRAHAIRNWEDVMREMEFETTTVRGVPVVVELWGREKELYDLLTAQPTHFDVLCHHTGMQAGEMSATLTMLELAGLIVRHPGDWYARRDPDVIAVAAQTPPDYAAN